ncbi:MAG: CDP-alcohol phosphatidyltransferase family protein, partial [Pseudomonadota bacterium]
MHQENAAPTLTNEGRPRELEDWLNAKLYHPLSMRLAKGLVPTPVTPNMVSIAGGAMIIVAAVVYGLSGSWMGVAFALVLHMSWHVLDGADGDLARLTGRTSSTGEVVDGICDIAGHVVLYVSLGIMLAQEVGSLTAWILAVGAGFGRIVQAAHYEVQRRQYQHWVYDKSWLRASTKTQDKPKGIFGLGARLYVSLGKLLAPGGQEVDELVGTSKEPQKSALLDVIRRETAPVIRSTYLLSANYRTIALGISMLAGSAIYFFIFEAVFLSLVLAVSLRMTSRSALFWGSLL